MHLPSITTLLPALAALATASPNNLLARNNDQVAQAIQFAALADGCSLIKCAEVIANVACIAAAIIVEPETGGTSTAAVIACVKEGLGEVCECGACVPGLSDFLTNNKVC